MAPTTRATTASKELIVQPVQRVQQMKRTHKIAKQAMEATYKALVEQTQLRNTVLVMPEEHEITTETLQAYSQDYNDDPANELRTNAVTECGVQFTTTNRDFMQNRNTAYTHVLSKTPRAASQEHSGRCWLFAALNLMRSYVIEENNLNDRFEFSQSYLFFYDKLERANFYLTKMLELRDMDCHDPVYLHCLTSHSPVQDGGNWSYVCNLIEKYGIVPKSVFRESVNSSYTEEMNELLQSKLGLFTTWIRQNTDVPVDTVRQKIVREMLPEIYKLLCIALGEPLHPHDSFDWEYNESSDNFESKRQKGKYRRVKGLTPMSFYTMYVKPHLVLDEMVHLIHDPRSTHETHRTYKIEHSGQVVGGLPEIMFSVNMGEMKAAAAESIANNDPVWFACDVGKHFDPYNSLLATEASRAEAFFDMDLEISKEDGLNSFISYPTHAMTLVGVGLAEKDDFTTTEKWKVENSWGESPYDDEDPGYLQMTDAWFDRHVYSTIVNIRYLPVELQDKYMENKYMPFTLPYTDPFSSVARL